MNEAALRGYLLGKLTESEAELVENRLIEDADLFSQMETAEDDLFDAYARGTLDANERARFLERFGAEGSRRRFASALTTRTTPAKVIRFMPRRWMDLAAAAVILLGVAAYLIPRAERPSEPLHAEQVAAPVSSVAETTSRVALVLATSRSTGAPVGVSVSASATQIDLMIRLNAADRYPAYGVEIRSQADNIVWGATSLKSNTENGDLVVHAMVPAGQLPNGAYEVAVRGGASPTALDDLGFLTIEVRRTQ